MVHGGDDAVEHMVKAVVLPGALNSHHIPGIRYHADGGSIPLGRGADAAKTACGKILANGAAGHIFLGADDGVGKFLSFGFRQAQHMESKALGRLAADTGQAGKLFYQLFKRNGKIFHIQPSF